MRRRPRSSRRAVGVTRTTGQATVELGLRRVPLALRVIRHWSSSPRAVPPSFDSPDGSTAAADSVRLGIPSHGATHQAEARPRLKFPSRGWERQLIAWIPARRFRSPARSRRSPACWSLAPRYGRRAFREKQPSLQRHVASPARPPVGRSHDPVAWDRGEERAAPHRPTNGPRGPRRTDRSRDLSIGDRLPGRNRPHDFVHAHIERRQTLQIDVRQRPAGERIGQPGDIDIARQEVGSTEAPAQPRKEVGERQGAADGRDSEVGFGDQHRSNGGVGTSEAQRGHRCMLGRTVEGER